MPTHSDRPQGYSYSYDGGITWTNVQYTYQLPVTSVGGSLIQLDPNTLVFAAPQDPNDTGASAGNDDLGQLQRRPDLDARANHQL